MKCDSMAQLTLMVHGIRKGYATGSQVIGGAGPESDHDFVMTEAEARELARWVGVESKMCDCARYGLRFMSFKYRLSEGGQDTNLIVVPDNHDLEAWKFATEETKTIGGSVACHKKVRASVFECFLKIYYYKNKLKKRGDEV